MIIKLAEPPLPRVVEDATRIHTPLERVKLLGFMRKNHGMGLAAPQIGETSRWAIVGKRFVYNPVIIARSEEEVEFIEGCLSMPGRLFKVKRPRWIMVEFTNHLGQRLVKKAKGIESIVWSHEIDHLNNKLICDVGEEVQKND